MGLSQIPTDYFITSHAFTKTTHRDVYPGIDPASPKLSQKGKTVIVTGASQGIGKAIAIAFAQAGANKIVLVSRSITKLEGVKQEILKINEKLEVFVVPTDTTSETSVQHLEDIVKNKVGVPDVLVNGAGVWLSSDAITESKAEEWWGDFEGNLKGTYLMTRSFLRLVGMEREASIVNVGSWGMLSVRAAGTSYAISKLAMARLSEAMASGYQKIVSTTFHPGMIKTDMAHAHGEVLYFCEDTVELAAGTAVYLSTAAASYLSGRYISANWDVGELEALQSDIVSNNLLMMDLKGKFGPQIANIQKTATPAPPKEEGIVAPAQVAAPKTIDSITLYPYEEGAKFDIGYFANIHLPLALHHWRKYGMRSYTLTDFSPSGKDPKPLYNAQLTVTWDSEESIKNALTGPDRNVVLDDVPNFTSVPGFTLTGVVAVST